MPGSALVVCATLVAFNSASEGGGMYLSPFSHLLLVQCHAEPAQHQGEASTSTSTSPEFPSFHFHHNSAARGGGLYVGGVQGEERALTGLHLTHNKATVAGAGVYVQGLHTLLLRACTVAQGESQGSGGGVHVEGGTGVILKGNTTVEGNQARVGGGLYMNVSPSLAVEGGSSIHDNQVTWQGGNVALTAPPLLPVSLCLENLTHGVASGFHGLGGGLYVQGGGGEVRLRITAITTSSAWKGGGYTCPTVLCCCWTAVPSHSTMLVRMAGVPFSLLLPL